MKAARRILAGLGTAMLAALALSACGESLPANVVAEVGSQQITKAAYEHWLRITVAQRTHVPATQAPIPVPPDYKACIANLIASEAASAKQESNNTKAKPHPTPTATELKAKCAERYGIDHQLALSFLIGNAWLNGEAAALGAKVGNAELQKEFAKLKKEGFGSEAAFQRFLTQNGYTQADLLLKTRGELLRTALGKKLVALAETKPITKQQIVNYYHHNTSRAFRPESKGVLVLLTPTEAQTKAAKSEIESGQSFTSVAGRVSIFHTAGQGGAYMTALPGHNAKALETAIWKLKPNALTGPVKTPQGFFLLELKKTTPGSTESLPQAERSIRFALRRKYLEDAITQFPKEFKAKWTAKTTCRAGYVVEQCKEYKP